MGRLTRLVAAEAVDWLDELIRYTPGRVGRLARGAWNRRRLAGLGSAALFEHGTVLAGASNIRVGNQFSLFRGSTLRAEGGRLTIGNRVSVNANVSINASDGGDITVGDDVLIGPNVVLRASNHVFAVRDRPINQQGHTGGRIVVSDGVWIGANAVVVPGVVIGAHAVVGAGAVVTRDVAPWMIVGGVPARAIGRRRGPD